MDVQHVWRILDGIQAQIRAYDTKAQIVIGIDGALAGFLVTQTTSLATALVATWPQAKAICLAVSAALCILLLTISIGFATFTIYPRLKLNQPNSLAFFDHIVRLFGANYEKARETYAGTSEDDVRSDLSNQVLANAIVCSRKAARFHHALHSMAVGLVFWLATVCFYFFVQMHAGEHPIM